MSYVLLAVADLLAGFVGGKVIFGGIGAGDVCLFHGLPVSTIAMMISAAGRDYGVLSGVNWRLADLGAKHSMLLAALGWGNMPAHLVEDDIARGRLKVIRPADFDSRTSQLVMSGAYRTDRPPGPAGQLMVDHLSGRNS